MKRVSFLLTVFLMITVNGCDSEIENEKRPVALEDPKQIDEDFIGIMVNRVDSFFKRWTDRGDQKDKGENNVKVEQVKADNKLQRHLAQVTSMQSIEEAGVTDSFLSDEEFIAYKRKLAVSADIEEKREAVIAISEANKPDSIDYVINALDDNEPEVRIEAVIQLKNHVNNPKAIKTLIQLLEDEDEEIVLEAVESLSIVNDARVIKKLKSIGATHPDKLIREVAQDYIERLEGEES